MASQPSGRWSIAHPSARLGRGPRQAHPRHGRRRRTGPARHGPRTAQPLRRLPMGPPGQRRHAFGSCGTRPPWSARPTSSSTLRPSSTASSSPTSSPCSSSATRAASNPPIPTIGPVICWLERWRDHAVEAGTRALGALRIGVHDAIEVLGTGCVSHPANSGLRDDLDSGRLDRRRLPAGLLRLVYRLLFCFVAEDRDLLLDPDASTDVKASGITNGSPLPVSGESPFAEPGTTTSTCGKPSRLVLDGLGKEDGCAQLGLVGLGRYLRDRTRRPRPPASQLNNRHCSPPYAISA